MAVPPLEQISSFQQEKSTNVYSLASQALHGVCELVELNIQTIGSSLQQAEVEMRNGFTLKSPEAFIIDQAKAVQPLTEKGLAYGYRVFDILSSVQSGFAKAVNTDFVENSERARKAAGEWVETMPGGMELVTNALDSVFSGVSGVCETLRLSANQAVELAQKNFGFAAPALMPVKDQ